MPLDDHLPARNRGLGIGVDGQGLSQFLPLAHKYYPNPPRVVFPLVNYAGDTSAYLFADGLANEPATGSDDIAGEKLRVMPRHFWIRVP